MTDTISATPTPVYDVIATFDGTRWDLRAPGWPTLRAHATRLDLVQKTIRAGFAFFVDRPTTGYALRVIPQLPDESLDQAVVDTIDARRDVHHARSRADQMTRDTAHRLHEAGVSITDIGDLLGISRQRASQLLAESATSHDTIAEED
ncbi:MAG: hypothetical protein FWD75_06675 [Propionibacteriaceae bacterium]|nr:hypothetical protein [Propionibacteriaceae bacterium]